MLFEAKNPWGVVEGFDVQRTDLWRLNLSSAVTYFSSLSDSVFAAVGLRKQELPSAETAAFHAIRCSLPVQKISQRKVIENTVPRAMPAYVEALDTVKVDFIHDTNSGRSTIFTLLQIWRALTRMGRVGISESNLLFSSAKSRPQFRFDIKVELLNGSTSDEDSGTGFAQGASYYLFRCWPIIVQQGTIDKGRGAQVHVISAQFQAEEIQ
jgi:hypothetical protein